MHTYTNDATIVDFLKAYRVPVMTRKVFDAKFAEIAANPSTTRIGPQRDALQQQHDWPHAMAVIVRNRPDERGITTTTLPNKDALAALLATRLGINMHLAVALAYDDVIEAARLNDGTFTSSEIHFSDAVVLATFSHPQKAHSELALLARKDIREFKLRFKPEELILFAQDPEVGLYQPYRTSYFTQQLEASISYRIGECVYGHLEEEPVNGSAIPFAPEAVQALRDELRASSFKASGSEEETELEVQRHVQDLVNKHLGENACAAAVSINGGPVRVDLGDFQ